MEAICSPEPAPLEAEARAELFAVARRSVQEGLLAGAVWEPDAKGFGARLQEARACFVTLHVERRLRGCVGTLQARRPLVVEVARSAHGAAFRDPRFAPVSASELAELAYHISVLSSSEPMVFSCESDLLRQLRPGLDGLVLRDAGHTGTFLPDVWKNLPHPMEFLRQLRLKAGLAPDHWSDTLTVARYTTESFDE